MLKLARMAGEQVGNSNAVGDRLGQLEVGLGPVTIVDLEPVKSVDEKRRILHHARLLAVPVYPHSEVGDSTSATVHTHPTLCC